MCYAIQNPNSDYDYGTIGMCLLIIYSTALSVVLILKQPIEIIKEVVEEVVKVDVQTQMTKEEDEEVIEKEVVKVDEDEEEEEEDEDELLLANYRIKEREEALQEIYKERAEQAVEKWKEAYSNMINFNVGNGIFTSLPGPIASNRLKEWFEKDTEYGANGKPQSTSLKAAMNMIYRLETEEHLVRVERNARREAVYAFKKIQFNIHFDFDFDAWPRVLKEEYYPQDALDIIKINKAHKLMTHL